MKHSLLVLLFFSASTFANPVLAVESQKKAVIFYSAFTKTESGQYVCDEVLSGVGSTDLANTLNSLKCDTLKPFTVNRNDYSSMMVCCVQR